MINFPLFAQRCRRRALLCIVGLLTVSPVSAATVAETGKDTSISGEWIIMSVLDYATISVGADQATPLVGKDLIISAQKVAFGNQVCSDPTFAAERVETNIELAENAHVNNDKLALPNPVTVVELSCAYAYIKNRSRIVLAWNGIFFEAARKSKRKAALHAHRNPTNVK